MTTTFCFSTWSPSVFFLILYLTFSLSLGLAEAEAMEQIRAAASVTSVADRVIMATETKEEVLEVLSSDNVTLVAGAPQV